MWISKPHEEKCEFGISFIVFADEWVLSLFVVDFGVNSGGSAFEGREVENACALDHPFWQFGHELRLVEEVAGVELGEEGVQFFGGVRGGVEVEGGGPEGGEERGEVAGLGGCDLWDEADELFDRDVGVEEHKEEVYFLWRLRELVIGLKQVGAVVEVTLRLLLQEFDHLII